MKKTIFLLLFTVLFFTGFANHIKGGFFTYQYKGPGISNTSFLRYDVTLTVYMLCNPMPAQVNNPVNFSFFNSVTGGFIQDRSVGISNRYDLNKVSDEPCITGDQTACYYTIIVYRLTNVELAPLAGGYTISYQRCCRINNMENINNSATVGNTYTIKIPGSNAPFNLQTNSSPQFPVNDTAVVCENNYFTLPFQAIDPDGDSLTYSLCGAFTGGSQADPAPNSSNAPPYSVVPYTNPFNGAQPMGSLVTINPVTGLISGTAPGIVRGSGEYVVCVCVREFRNGVFVGETRKELHVKVGSCEPIRASLNPQYITCDGFTLTFSNNSPSTNINSHFWDFGVPTIANDTSILQSPTYTYADTGVYLLKLVVNRGQSCSDSTTSRVSVFPGFFPGFVSNGLCKNTPIQFTDTSLTRYGFVDSWSWNFGDPTTLADTSRLKNPTYSYTTAGVYDVSLTVTNSKGCTKIVIRQVTVIETPSVTVPFRDSTYCGLDTLTLGVTSSVPSTFSWTPLVNIINPNSANPQVFPTVPTKYYVVADAGGCFGRDSITVNPRNDLIAIALANPLNICEGDTVNLTGSSNHAPITWQWTPVSSVLAPASQSTKAFPTTNTTYTLTARWGNNCIASNSKTVTVKPLAIPNAGPDVYICAGQTGSQLNASGGDNYQWTPAAGLSATNIPNPFASPLNTTTYIVSVGVTGCTARRTDSVVVEAKPLPALIVSNDTLICTIDTLQLFATGNGSIFWTPNYNISSQTSASPSVSPDLPTKYYINLTDAFNCSSRDSVFVNVISSVSLNAGPDTTICQTDAISLDPASNGLQYSWTPVTGLDNPSAKNPVARPDTTTTYFVVARVGKCQASDDIEISVAPYPVPNAGLDTTICFGGSTQLQANGGDVYTWTPAAFLSNPNIPNPTASPPRSMLYTVSVRSTTSGCPKPRLDSVLVTIRPRVIADAGPRDTIVVRNQPLQLNGSGGLSYLWSPPTGLNNTAIRTPVALLNNDQQYILTVRDAGNCTDTDTIDVIVYKINADLYVPSAFTPNGDGKNDVFRPIPIGIKSISYFRVYNRWGILMFSTTEQRKGWDGRYNGKGQDSDTFVWVVQGIDFEGNRLTRKGFVILIR